MTTPSEPDEEFDFGDEEEGPAPLPRTVPYDPSRDRERVRGWLALGAMGLLTLYAVGIAALAAALVRPFDDRVLSSLLTGVFTPLVTIVGTVGGFYFGSRR